MEEVRHAASEESSMARFRYRMQSILDLKLKTEGQAKTEFGLARRALIEEEEKLEALYARKERFFEESRKMREEASLPVRDIMEIDRFMETLDDMIAAQKLAIIRAEEVVEEKRRLLEVEMQERKMQERLREKAFEKFRRDERLAEYKEIDERSSFVYGNSAGNT